LDYSSGARMASKRVGDLTPGFLLAHLYYRDYRSG
jgi:hypothetical protein